MIPNRRERFGWLRRSGLYFVLGCLCWFACTRGAVQAAENVVVIVLDDSRSMLEKMQTDQGKQARMVVAKQALRRVIEQLPDETKLGVLLLTRRWLAHTPGSHRSTCFGGKD
jgi:hypothetical protein